MTLQEVRQIKEEIKRLSMMTDDAEKHLLVEIESRKQWHGYDKSKTKDWDNEDIAGNRAVGALKHSIIVAKHRFTSIVYRFDQ